MQADLVQTAREAFDRARVGRGDPVLVACSGGHDSTALADVAARLRAAGRLGAVHLAYVDHGLRAGSATDGDTVRALAESLECGYVSRAVVVDQTRASLEAAARDARYPALIELADEVGAAWVLLGHTASDQAETVFMRIVRGTGVAGLVGIPERRGRFVRPLLRARRSQIETYVEERAMAPVRDPMNRDERFARTRARHRWLPALAEENPRVAEALVRLAESAAEQREVLEFAAGALLDSAGGDASGLDRRTLREAPAGVLKAALAGAAAAAGAGSLSARHLEAMADAVCRPAAGTVTVDGPGIVLVCEYETVRLERPSGGAPRLDVELRVAGLAGPYRVRAWQPGDRMRPERLAGKSRRISDLYVDAKVPRRLREGAQVVELVPGGEIVWAEHLGAAHGHSVTVTLTRRPPGTTSSD